MMKRIYFVIFCMAVFAGCDEHEVSLPLEGSWELRSYQGGLLPGRTFEAGSGPVMKFTDSEYEHYVDGQLVKKGSYTVKSEKSFLNNRIMARIIYDGDNNEMLKTFFEISGRTLTVYYAAPISVDGLESVYKRQVSNGVTTN